MTRLDAIREIIIQDSPQEQIEYFDRYLRIFTKYLSQGTENAHPLLIDAPFDLKKKLVGELTGKRVLSMFSIIFAVINAPRTTIIDRLSTIENLYIKIIVGIK